jgi:hypothetical protein
MWNENLGKQVNVTYKNVKDDRKFAFSFGLSANTGLLSDASIKCNQVGCLESIKLVDNFKLLLLFLFFCSLSYLIGITKCNGWCSVCIPWFKTFSKRYISELDLECYLKNSFISIRKKRLKDNIL